MANQEMVEILRKLFKTNPENSTIVLTNKCSECGCDVTVNITPTSEGFGLQGGALFRYSPYECIMKCHDCFKVNPTNPSRKFGSNL
jgi:hypothetical protein